MRESFEADGRIWDVVVGRESWGTVFALFLSRGGQGEARQALLAASSTNEGSRLLVSLTDEELSRLFEGSSPKPND